MGVRLSPAVLHKSKIFDACPGFESKDIKYPPVGFVQEANPSVMNLDIYPLAQI